LENQRMRRGEDLRTLHAQGGQFIDVEETAIVDFVGGDAPRRESIRLIVEQAVKQIEAKWIARCAVEPIDDGEKMLAYLGAAFGQDGETALDDFLLPLTFGDALRGGLGACGQIANRRQDTLIFVKRRRIFAKRCFQLIEIVSEDS